MIETSTSQSESPEPDPAQTLDVGDCHAEFRCDPITGARTIYAPHRSARPDEFVSSGDLVKQDLACPFCSGHEDATLPAVWVGKFEGGQCHVEPQGGNDPDWSVRVVPNLYPAVETGSIDLVRPRRCDLFVGGPVFGGHDVFVESREHVQSFSQLELAEAQLTFLAYRDRVRHWRSEPGVSYISLFKNVGYRAGASLRHCHSQLIAVDHIPIAVNTALQKLDRHRAETGCCLHCDLIRAEQEAQQRIVWQDDSLIAFCPFASRLPMLLRITTRQHQSRFEDLSDGMIESVSRLVHRAVSWLESIQPGTAYNFTLSTAPPAHDDRASSFHWSMDLFPRMTQIAGFEWNSGSHINPVLPEVAAAAYRAQAIAEDPRQS